VSIAAPAGFRVIRLARMTVAAEEGLARVLVDCVEGGASVSFMHPLDLDKARAFWRGLGPDLEMGKRIVLVAEDGTGIAGTVQIALPDSENQPHRADLAKMLVHRRARGRGLGATLVRAAEDAARERGKSLLVLDTATGSDAERLYCRLGWQKAGTVPDYALGPRGGLCATTFYYRQLG
jgi:GNAT superfamily N-acetyltransferase